MAKVKGICRNEDCIKLNEIQEVEKTEFVCPECGDPLIPFGGGGDGGNGSWWNKHGKKVIGGIVVALLAGGGAGYALLGGDAEPPTPPVVKVADPVISPNSGEHKSPVTVTIECATDSANIYYTDNGEVPTEASNLYVKPLRITKNTTIKAIACKPGEYTNSEVSTAEITIKKNTDGGGSQGGDVRRNGTLNLAYGKYVGEILNGKPDGAGVLTYTKQQKVVSTKDVVAEPGERIEGVFENGKASFVTLYKKDGNAIKIHR